jgi:hypothetical protein
MTAPLRLLRSRPRRFLPALLCGVLAAAGAARSAGAAPTVLHFEDLPAGTWLTTQYSAAGVLFATPVYVDSDTSARSPTHVLRSNSPAAEFDFDPLRIGFTSPQVRVKLYAGRMFGTNSGTLRAYDGAGNLILTDGPRAIAAGTYNTVFQVQASSAVIARVELQYDGSDFECIDDLEFEGTPPPPPPTTPPSVVITAPLNGVQLFSPSLTVRGTATGDQIFSGTLAVRAPRPPGSQVPDTTTYPLTLTGTGSTRSFTQAVSLGVGPQTLTARVTNTGSLTGSATITATYLPQLIRDRYAADGGATTYGSFQFGAGAFTACQYAVYANGAVAQVGTASHTVRGAIFTKWLALKDLSAYPRLGCPTSEPRTLTFGSAQVLAQDFQNGRIYSGPLGTFFVPSVLLPALDGTGGEAATGVPAADPSSSPGAMQTWLFQPFQRASGQRTTMEMRGSPPRLYLERQGGDLSLFAGTSMQPAEYATFVQSWACTSDETSCPLGLILMPMPIQDMGRYCNYATFNWARLIAYATIGFLGYMPVPPEWVALYGDYRQTQLYGVIQSSHRSDGDNPWAHENVFEPCPTPTVEALANETICPSDWDIKLALLPVYRSYLAAGIDTLKIETELAHAQYFFTGWDEPRAGELVFTSGRFIADCGHNDPNWKTEIHPPSVLVKMKTENYYNLRSTQADVWINGFYSGEPVDFDIYPPPRPSPTATLGYVKPTDPGLDVTIVSTTPDSNRVHVHLTASTRHVDVTALGEMKLQSGRGYYGRWQVYWSN